MHTHRIQPIPFWLLFAALACAPDHDSSSAFKVDTLPSGRVMVTNGTTFGSTPPAFAQLERIARIGAVDGAASETFGRIHDVAIGPDTNLYVLDAQAAEVRVFNTVGRHLRTIGSKGAGPGELATPYSIWIDSENTLWVADEGNRRYSQFTLQGELLDTYPSPFRGGPGRGQVRVLGNEIWDLDVITRSRELPDGSVERQSLGVGFRVFRVEDVLVPSDSIAFGPWSPNGLIRMAGAERLIARPPYSPRRVQDVGVDGTVWVGTGDSYAFHQVGREGDTLRTVIRNVDGTALSEQDANLAAEWMHTTLSQGFQGDASVLPGTYPFFSRIVLADDGKVWVLRDAGGDAFMFDVFTPDGRYTGSLATTVGAAVHPHITRDLVLGVSEDSLGVQFVELHRIARQ